MNFEQLKAYDVGHKAWEGTSAQEKPCLYGLIMVFRPHRVIEIGVRGAHGTAWIALALEHGGRGHLWAVDKWTSPNSPWPRCYDDAVQRLKDTGLSHRVSLVRSDSVEFLKAQEENGVEIVVVDGGHSYRQAMADIEEGLRVASGLVMVHDATNIVEVNRACKDIGGGTWLYGTHPTESRGYWVRNTGPAPGEIVS